MVTSRLVVGSSAIRSAGSQEMAMAPTMRWRIPPDIWCGYSLTRVSGAAILTAFKRSRALVHGPAVTGRRSRRSGSQLAELGIQLDAEPVAEEVGGEDHEHDAAAGQHGEPPVAGHQALLAVGQHQAPRGLGGRHTHTEEGEGGLLDDDHAQ